MVVKADHERIKTLLKDTITLLCRNGLNFKTEFSVEALIGITLDKEDVVLVSINEIIRAELGSQLTLAKDVDERNVSLRSLDHEDSSESQPGTPVSTNGHRYRKRKLSSGQGSQRDMPEDGQEPDSGDDEGRPFEKAGSGSVLGEESNSEPANKRSMDDSNMAGTRIKDDDTKDVIYIKEEIDTGDWPDGSHTQDSFADPNIPAPSGSDQQHDDNFDFLHGSSLVPVSSDSSVQPSWGDVSHSASSGLIISPSKRSSTATGVGTQGEHSQQKFGQAIYSLASRQGCVQVKHGEGGSPVQYTCTICYRTVKTRRGFEAHMGQHLGVYRYNCNFCRKGFPSTTALKDHQRSHTGQKLLCPSCGKQFVSYSGLSQHLKVTHQWSSLQVRNQMHGEIGGRTALAFGGQAQFPSAEPPPSSASTSVGPQSGAAVSSQQQQQQQQQDVPGGVKVADYRQSVGDGLPAAQQCYRVGDGDGQPGGRRHRFGEEMSSHQQLAGAVFRGDGVARHQPHDDARQSVSSPGVSAGGYITSHHRLDRYLSTDSTDSDGRTRQQTDRFTTDDDPETFQFDPDTSL